MEELDKIKELAYATIQASKEDPKKAVKLFKDLINLLKLFVPAGLEWAVEIGSSAGTTYILEDGKLEVIIVSRDEFGPFMGSSVREIDVESVPEQTLLQTVSRFDSFLVGCVNKLKGWLSSIPEENPKKFKVSNLCKTLETIMKEHGFR